MSAPSPADAVRALAEPLARQAGLFLESVTVTPAGRRRVLRVVVDLPENRTGGVPMEAVATASQAISEALDTSNVMGGLPYVLEVSSPGADRPLVERRHWLRARGRLVQVLPAAGGVEATGRLTDVTDEGVVLDGDQPIGWAAIDRGRIELEFGRPDDLDEATDGLDENEDENEEDVDGALDGLEPGETKG